MRRIPLLHAWSCGTTFQRGEHRESHSPRRAQQSFASTPLALLHSACLKGWHEMVRRLLDGDSTEFSVHSRSGKGNQTPLFCAVATGDLKMVELLVEYGAEIFARDAIDRTPLHSAAEHGWLDLVKYFLDRDTSGNEVSATTTAQKQPLHYAVVRGHVEVCRFLLNRGADVKGLTFDGWTPLHLAAQDGYLEVAKLLVEHGAEVNATNDVGWTPLHFACDRGLTDMVTYFFSLNADRSFRTSTGGATPVFLSAIRGHLHLVDLFLDNTRAGEIPQLLEDSNDEGYTLLHYAAYQCPITLQRLLSKGANKEAKSLTGFTPLHTACGHCATQCVQILVEVGADVTVYNEGSWQAIHVASQKGFLEVVSLLVERDRSLVESRTGQMWTPLHLAIDENHLDVAQFLIDHGACVEAKTSHHMSPLHLSVRRSNFHAVSMLLHANADPNVRNRKGWTPLQRAAAAGQLETVHALVASSADIHLRVPHGLTALDFAQADMHQPVVDFLLSQGAQHSNFSRKAIQRADGNVTKSLPALTRHPQTNHQAPRMRKGAHSRNISVPGLESEFGIQLSVQPSIRPKVFFTPIWEVADWLHLTLGTTEGLQHENSGLLRCFRTMTFIAASIKQYKTNYGNALSLDYLRFSLESFQQFLFGCNSLHFKEHFHRINEMDGRLILKLWLVEDQKMTAEGRRVISHRFRGELFWHCFWTGDTISAANSTRGKVWGTHANEFAPPLDDPTTTYATLTELLRAFSKSTGRFLTRIQRDQNVAKSMEDSLHRGVTKNNVISGNVWYQRKENDGPIF